MKHVGVLGLQGGYERHRHAFEALGVRVSLFRYPEELPGLDGIVLPGGESTTMGTLLERHGLIDPLAAAIRGGLPVFATCAGAILLADRIEGSVKVAGVEQHRLGGLDITVRRNAYGSQVDSFEAVIDLKSADGALATAMDAIFIRAPLVLDAGPGVEVLGRFAYPASSADQGGASALPAFPVLVRQKNILAATFHPELGSNPDIHRYFLSFS